jgi:hypothetical protein
MMMAEAVIDADTLYQESSLATGDTLACIFDNEGRLESGTWDILDLTSYSIAIIIYLLTKKL